jgi:hypothetical protein
MPVILSRQGKSNRFGLVFNGACKRGLNATSVLAYHLRPKKIIATNQIATCKIKREGHFQNLHEKRKN